MHERKWNSKYTENLKKRANILKQNTKANQSKEQVISDAETFNSPAKIPY